MPDEKMENASTDEAPKAENLVNDSENSSGKTVSSASSVKRKSEDDDDDIW